MKLWLIRHAHALSPSEWLGDDIDRPLTDLGRSTFKLEAKKTFVGGVHPEIIFSSPAERCRETALILSEITAVPVKIASWLLIETTLRRILEQLKTLPNKTIALVGHQPEVEALYRKFSRKEEGTLFNPGDCRCVEWERD